MIKLIHIYGSETDLNAHTRSDTLLYLIVHGWCTFFILILGKMLSSINLMGFSTLPAMDAGHQAGCAPTIPPLLCFHQHSVISSFNYSPAFCSVLSSCQAPLPFKFLIYAQSFCCGFECCPYPQASSLTPTLIHRLALGAPGHGAEYQTQGLWSQIYDCAIKLEKCNIKGLVLLLHPSRSNAKNFKTALS